MIGLSGALMASVTLFGPVLAPTEETTQPEDRVGFHEKVVVTAQKREELLREVPISLTAFTSHQLEEAGVEKPEDFFGLTPNVFLADSFTVGNSLVTSRGVAQTNNGESPLAIVVDGVYQGNQKQLNHELFDVQRVEILKGPEGALYGRNSIGGALNIVTKQPTRTFEGQARASLGNGSSFGGAVAVSGPMHGEELLYRFSGSYKESDGLIDNVFLGTEADFYEDTTGRFQLRWNATPRFSLDWRASMSDTEGGAVLYSIFPTTGFANDFSFPPEQNILGFSERDLDDYSVRAEWAGEALTLTAITGYSEVGEIYRADADFSHPGGRIMLPAPLPPQIGQGQDLDVRLLSQELRLASPDDRRVRWIAGAYLLETDRELVTQLFADTDGTIGGFAPIVQLAEDNDNTAWALFGQADVKLCDRWALSASARYDEDDREQTDLMMGGTRQATFNALQPRLTVTYTRSDRLMAYMNAGTGFRSGGYNAPSVTPDVFEREISRNLEFGLRSSMADERVRIDGAVYATRLDDAQFFRVDFASASQIIDNMNDVEIFGVELSVTARPVQGLEVYGTWGRNDTEIDDFDGSGAFDGNQTPNNIRSMLNVGAQYARPIGRGLVGVARADWERRGKQYWAPDNLDVQDPVTLLNLRFTLSTGAWSVAGWARNVTDEEYYVEYGDAFWAGVISGDDIAWPGRPRSYGLDIIRKF